ncbi:MAG: type II toxin-antitoxin system Phd/YefM family antitoxin [Solidesulfovibrio sp.]
MDAITYSTARGTLVETMQRVCRDHEPIIITRRGAEAVVMMSLADYNAIEETAYLLRSPANAARLRESAAQAEAGRLETHGLLEE